MFWSRTELTLELIQYTYMILCVHMARRKLEDRSIRKLTRTGGGKSISVTLPIEIVRKLAWRDKQKVVVTKLGNGILITDWKK